MTDISIDNRSITETDLSVAKENHHEYKKEKQVY